MKFENSIISKSLLSITILIFFYLMMFPIIIPQSKRALPVEPDDAFSYLVKAKILDEYIHNPQKTVTSLNQLASQLNFNQETDLTLKWVNYVWYFRIISVYHPLHSLGIIGLNYVFDDWIRSYKWSERIGGIIIALGIVCIIFLYKNDYSKILSLLTLGGFVFPGQGLHYIIPSTINYGFLFLIIWYLSNAKKAIKYWYLIIPIFLYGIHIGGVYYSLVIFSVLLFEYVLKNKNEILNFNFDYKLVSLVGLGFLISFLLLKLKWIHPFFDLPINTWNKSEFYFDDVFKNIIGFYSSSNSVLISTIIFVTLIIILKIKDLQRVHLFTLAFSALFIVSFFYILPHNHGDVPRRFGSIAFILSIPVLLTFIINKANSINFTKRFRFILFAIFLLIVGVLVKVGFDSKQNVTNYLADRGNYSLNPNLLTSINQNRYSVSHTNPILLCYYIIQNGLYNSIQIDFFFKRKINTDYVTLLNPIYRKRLNGIKPGDSLLIENKTKEMLKIKLDSNLKLCANDVVSGKKILSDSLIVVTNESDKIGFLHSITSNNENLESQRWVWNFNSKLTLIRNGMRDSVSLYDSYNKYLSSINYTVQNDTSYSAILKVEHE